MITITKGKKMCTINGIHVSLGAIAETLFGTMKTEDAAKAFAQLMTTGNIIVNKKEDNVEAFICPTCKQEFLPF